MLPILALLFKAATGAGGIGATIAKLEAQKLASENTAEKLDLDRQIAELRARQAEQQGNAIDTAMRSSIALPFEIYLWKVIVYDMVLGYGTTAALPPQMWWIMGIVITFYFLATNPLKRT